MKKLILILVLLAAGTGIYYLRGSPVDADGKRGGRGDGAVAVLVALARKADVPVTLDAVGTVQSLNSVTVRAQIDGKLMKIAFSDGQDVKAGDVLALVDPTTAQALYDQAAAKKAQNMALLNNARLDSVRYKKLAQTEYGSRQQADTQDSTVAQLEAQVRSDQASIDNYKAQLEFTTIRAPIDGRTGIRNVDAGNIIRASDANGLVVITQLKPMGLVFSLAQQNLRVVSGAMAKQILSVQVLDSDNISVLDTGTLTVVDNTVDQTTGTVKLKATVPNANLQLWPGQFVNVRLLVDTLKQVVVVPSSAVQRGPTGPYVYVLGEGDKVSLKPVTIGQQDEMNAVITSGLEAGVKVVTTGFTRLTDGAKVTATEASEQSVVEAVPLKKGGGRKRGEKEGGGKSVDGAK
jgi:membrane fusion protein, multidrug efflux system